ncbi:MAG: hypothetical protein A2Y10_12155 [Planctomycetes bacterium GWF2_41_51]|nr:MAG: hypothetical protein A2Y10_12155 [Planctomycetes bacterium GWF2_41_51]HBG28699.1 hypothetical protein [Phycisphaerales bacterium]
MKKWIFASLILASAAICFLGCQQQQEKQQKSKAVDLKEAVLLSVDFQPDTEVVYNFVSERTMTINLDPSGKYSKGKKDGKEQSQSEKLEMQIAYKPVKLDPLGVSTIEATCRSAKVTRVGSGRGQDKTDAVESLVGKSFTLSISPTGKIVDYSSLEKISKELGEKAFSGGDGKRGKVKNPDMIMDFLATQWNIWDTVAAIKNPAKGLTAKSKWNSKLIAPMPYVSKIARDVDYSLAGVKQTETGTLAEIESVYTLSRTPAEAPLPYSGSFQMKGMFGFLQGYKVLSLEGKGTQIFNIDKGMIVSDIQNYKAAVSASIMGLGSDELTPNIEIDQTITMKLVE